MNPTNERLSRMWEPATDPDRPTVRDQYRAMFAYFKNGALYVIANYPKGTEPRELVTLALEALRRECK